MAEFSENVIDDRETSPRCYAVVDLEVEEGDDLVDMRVGDNFGEATARMTITEVEALMERLPFALAAAKANHG